MRSQWRLLVRLSQGMLPAVMGRHMNSQENLDTIHHIYVHVGSSTIYMDWPRFQPEFIVF